MLSTKNFRPLFFVAIAALMLIASTSVEAVVPDALACVPCTNPPPCPVCRRGTWCDENFCRCTSTCRTGIPP
ncbi:hypothetical protein BGZ89_012117 [Linnemannia elongata]|nr:hypothetical protein BGZ89_012117 [Linnemannia elongata]